MPVMLDVHRLDTDDAPRELALACVRDITDPALRKHPPQRHRDRPGDDEIAQRRLMEDKHVPADHDADDEAESSATQPPAGSVPKAHSKRDGPKHLGSRRRKVGAWPEFTLP